MLGRLVRPLNLCSATSWRRAMTSSPPSNNVYAQPGLSFRAAYLVTVKAKKERCKHYHQVMKSGKSEMDERDTGNQLLARSEERGEGGRGPDQASHSCREEVGEYLEAIQKSGITGSQGAKSIAAIQPHGEPGLYHASCIGARGNSNSERLFYLRPRYCHGHTAVDQASLRCPPQRQRTAPIIVRTRKMVTAHGRLYHPRDYIP
jgi:hypothetical protein